MENPRSQLGGRQWTTSMEDASDIPEVIDGSDSSDDDINTVTVE